MSKNIYNNIVLTADGSNGSYDFTSINTAFLNADASQTQNLNVFGGSKITLGDATHNGQVNGYTGKNMTVQADNILNVVAGNDMNITADNIHLQSAGVDKLIIGLGASTFYNEVDCNNTFVINGVGGLNPGMRVPGTGFDYFGIQNGQIIMAPNGNNPRFGCFDAFSAFANDLTLFDTTISVVNYSLTGTGATFNLPLTFCNFTTAQRNALTPTSGMTIFNTDTNKLECYASGIWNALF